MSPEQQWPKAAALVMEKLKGHDTALEKIGDQVQGMQRTIGDQLGHIQIALMTAQKETHGRMDALEKSVEYSVSSIGSASLCKEHSKELTTLTERVDQHHYQFRERGKQIGDIWTEINKLREWVKSVNDAGLVDQTKGTVNWWMVWLVGVVGSVFGLSVGYLFMRIMGAS